MAKGQQIKPTINVTPLVDVVLVLLIIFMVVTPQLEKQDVQLPKMRNATSSNAEEIDAVRLTINRDGKLFVEKQPVAPNVLKERLLQFREQRPDQPLRIRADARLPYGKVRALFRACEPLGFPDILLDAQDEGDG